MSKATYEIESADFSEVPATYYYRATVTDEAAALDLAAKVGGASSVRFRGPLHRSLQHEHAYREQLQR